MKRQYCAGWKSLCWSAIVLLVQVFPAFSAIRPSFMLDYSAWNATHIVLAVATPTPGAFEVTESWKGDLRVGDRLVVPELRPTGDAVPISAYQMSREVALSDPASQLIPKQPSGSRVILFLVLGPDQSPTIRASKTEVAGWRPSDLFHSMQTSVVWIDGDGLYAFRQIMNPGPPIIVKLSESETQMRNRVAEINETEAQLAQAVSLIDGEERAERLRPLVGSGIFPARLAALKELGKCGPFAVPVISGMLDDSAFADEEPELVDALVDVGGQAVGRELNRRLRHELEFWKSKRLSLRAGWWNEDASIHAPLRQRFSVTYELLLGLDKARYPRALTTVTELRNLWRSMPPLGLNDDGSSNEMVDECDKLIHKLRIAAAK